MKKSFSFLQDFAFSSKSILKNVYRSIYFSLVYFFAKKSFISTSKVFYKLCKNVNSRGVVVSIYIIFSRPIPLFLYVKFSLFAFCLPIRGRKH